MPVIIVLTLITTVYFVADAARKGHNQWVYIILLVPVIGPLIYVLKFMIPVKAQPRDIDLGKFGFSDSTITRRDLNRLHDQLELSDNVYNRQRFAEGLLKSGDYDQAIALFESCLAGNVQEDLSLIKGLALAFYLKNDFETTLIHLESIRGKSITHEYSLLIARCHEELHDFDAAREVYAAIVNTYSGEEARCRYALLLKQLGEIERAGELFREVIRISKLSPDYYTRSQQKWIRLARKELVKLKLPNVEPTLNKPR